MLYVKETNKKFSVSPLFKGSIGIIVHTQICDARVFSICCHSRRHHHHHHQKVKSCRHHHHHCHQKGEKESELEYSTKSDYELSVKKQKVNEEEDAEEEEESSNFETSDQLPLTDGSDIDGDDSIADKEVGYFWKPRDFERWNKYVDQIEESEGILKIADYKKFNMARVSKKTIVEQIKQ